MKVSWELVSPLCPGSYIYPPLTEPGQPIGQLAARPALIGRQEGHYHRLETLTPETGDNTWLDSRLEAALGRMAGEDWTCFTPISLPLSETVS